MVTATQDQAQEEFIPMSDDYEIPSFDESNAAPAFEEIEEGLYILELTDIEKPEPVREDWNPDGTKMRAKFLFQVVENEDWEGYRVNDWYNLTLHENSKLYPIAKALMGGSFPKDVRVTPPMLKGKRMQAYLTLGDEDSKGRRWPQIGQVMPVATPKSKKPKTVTREELQASDDVPF